MIGHTQPPLQSQGSTHDRIIRDEIYWLCQYACCSLKELPYPVSLSSPRWCHFGGTNCSDLWICSLGILSPPPCHDLHKLSFDIDGAIFWQRSWHKHIIEKYRKASKLKYAKVFQRSVLPPPSDTAHASGLVRWQFGGVSLGLSALAEYSEVLKCTKEKQSKDVSLDLSPLSDIRPHQLSLLQASRHFHLIHQIPVQNHKRSDGNDSGYWCSLFHSKQNN